MVRGEVGGGEGGVGRTYDKARKDEEKGEGASI